MSVVIIRRIVIITWYCAPAPMILDFSLQFIWLSTPTGRVNKKLISYCILPAGCVPTAITEPLLAGVAVDHTGWIMNPTITKRETQSLTIESMVLHLVFIREQNYKNC